MSLWSWLHRGPTGRRTRKPLRRHQPSSPRVEFLEDRTVLSGNTLLQAYDSPLAFTNLRAATNGFLPTAQDVQLYRLDLTAGDVVTVSANAQAIGSGLNSALRIFDANGNQLAANDDFTGRDAALVFQASTSDIYFIGVSASGNDAYDPNTAPLPGQANVSIGATHGLFQLTVSIESGFFTVAAVTAAAFHVASPLAIPGAAVAYDYRLENRGGLDAGTFTVNVLISTDNRFTTPTLLDSFTVNGLDAGAAVSASSSVTLPGGLTAGSYFVGTQIVPTGSFSGNLEFNASAVQGTGWDSVNVLTPYTAGPSASLAAVTGGSAPPSLLNGLTPATTVSAGNRDYFTVTVAANGRLTAQLDGVSGSTLLTLMQPDGTVLIQSAGVNNLIEQHLAAGTYVLEVTPLTATAQYRLATTFTATASTPGSTPNLLVTADFNSDGIMDVATAETGITVLLGLGDGTFGTTVSTTLPAGGPVTALRTADFNRDGIADLAATRADGTVSIQLGLGDGHFAESTTLAVAGTAEPLTALGDFDNDGRIDVLLGGTGLLHVFLGAGDGTFTDAVPAGIAINGDFVGPLAIGDFNGDSCLDVTAASGTVLLGAGDGSFTQVANRMVNPANPASTIVVADFNGDGRTDLIELPSFFSSVGGNALNGLVKVSYGNGAGGFANPISLTTAGFPISLAATDLNNDGRWDLVYTTKTAVGVLLGIDAPAGDLMLSPPVTYALPLGRQGAAVSFAVADFNGDGRGDFLAGETGPASVAVFYGGGDGTFRINTQVPQHAATVTLVAGDFTNDGRADLAAANKNGNDLTVNLSEGDGFFLDGGSYRYPTGQFVALQPTRLIAGDFNGDGRLDLAAYYPFDGPFSPGGFAGTLEVFLGVGDGSFEASVTIDVLSPNNGNLPLFAADVNGDESTDIIIGQVVYIAHVASSGLSFTAASATLPGNIAAVGEFIGDDNVDLVVEASGLTILAGAGNGTFSTISVVGLGGAVTVGNFDNDVYADLAILNGGALHIYHGDGQGNFAAPTLLNMPAGTNDHLVSAADFDGDGIDDFAIAYRRSADDAGVVIFLNNSNNTFTEVAQELPIAPGATAIVTADFNGDGRVDVATVSSPDAFAIGRLTILLGRGDGTFADPTRAVDPTQRAVPQVADINGDGQADVVLLDQRGNIVYRPGTGGGNFGAPVILNNGAPARDFTLVTNISGSQTTVSVAALDFGSDTVSLYTVTAAGTVVRTAGPATGLLPTRIASADLNGDGLGDLVVVNTGSGDVSVLLATSSGFTTQTLTAGNGPADVRLADLDDDLDLDLAVVNAASSDVSVFINPGTGVFGSEFRFRADQGPYDLVTGLVAAQSMTTALTTGTFDGDALVDIITVNRDTNTFSLLTGLGKGLFGNARTFQTGSQPTAAVAGDFNDDGKLDVAILTVGDKTVSVFEGDGAGGFTRAFIGGAGNVPTGLTVADVDNNGTLDLLVGNTLGDMLLLLGTGHGTFASYQRVDQQVSLVVLQQGTDTGVILGNEGQDRVSMQNAQGANSPLLDRVDDVLAPRVQAADVNNDGYDDLIVLNGGGNTVDVYLGTASGDLIDLAAHKPFFVGTNPSSVIVADLNGDGIPDLVVTNAGSNDVSVLFGTGTVQGNGSVSNWSAKIGPRLSVGSNPDSVALLDVVHFDPVSKTTVAGGDGVADLVVSNQLSNDVWMVAGVGDGFFKDSSPLITAGLSGVILNSGTGAFFINQTTNVVTFVPDLATMAVRFVVSGVQGVGGFGGDFNSDGIADAVVLSSDGIVDLILGDVDGAAIAITLGTGLDDPSAVAFSGTQTGLFSFYVSYVNAENVEAAVQFAFDLGLLDQGSTSTVIDLAAVDDSALALIAVLVANNNPNATPTLEGGSAELTNTLLGLDSHTGGGDGEVSLGELTRRTELVRQEFVTLGAALGQEITELGKLMARALTEFTVGLRIEGGEFVSPLRTALAQTLGPVQQVVEVTGATMIQATFQVISRHFTAPEAVPTTRTPATPIAPELDLAFTKWEATAEDEGWNILQPASNLPMLTALLAEESATTGLLPTALLAAGLASGCLFHGDRERSPFTQQGVSRS